MEKKEIKAQILKNKLQARLDMLKDKSEQFGKWYYNYSNKI